MRCISFIIAVLVPQADGKILIGGPFMTVRGAPRNNIARLNPDGSVDATFDPGSGADDLVATINRQSDGKLILTGDFSTIDGRLQRRIARLHANGALDETFV